MIWNVYNENAIHFGQFENWRLYAGIDLDDSLLVVDSMLIISQIYSLES